eukprot:766463-Hanusia_phi.AAC.1
MRACQAHTRARDAMDLDRLSYQNFPAPPQLLHILDLCSWASDDRPGVGGRRVSSEAEDAVGHVAGTVVALDGLREVSLEETTGGRRSRAPVCPQLDPRRSRRRARGCETQDRRRSTCARAEKEERELRRGGSEG